MVQSACCFGSCAVVVHRMWSAHIALANAGARFPWTTIRVEKELWTFATFYLPHLRSDLADWTDEHHHLAQMLLDIEDSCKPSQVFVGGDANLDKVAAIATRRPPSTKVKPRGREMDCVIECLDMLEMHRMRILMPTGGFAKTWKGAGAESQRGESSIRRGQAKENEAEGESVKDAWTLGRPRREERIVSRPWM